ncbi:MAG: type II toxin-antitoxin system RelE/ParE family toxin [Planctomycetota bacterium]
MRQLSVHKSALKELDLLPAKQYRQVASAMLDLLKEPFPHYSKPLKGSSYHRLAVGEYRIVYLVDDSVIRVMAIGRRNDAAAYQLLKR